MLASGCSDILLPSLVVFSLIFVSSCYNDPPELIGLWFPFLLLIFAKSDSWRGTAV